jgi:hypothetical protein
VSSETERGEGGRAAHQRGTKAEQELGRRKIAAGERDHRRGDWITKGQRAREQRGKREPLARSRAGGLFLKRIMGAPDSLQCLSGAHRIAHTGEGDLARARPVHRTVHSVVSGAHRNVR